MNISKIIALFYIIYTIYIFLLVGATTLSFYSISIAVILMWVNYLFFKLGYKTTKTKKTVLTENKKYWLESSSKFNMLILMVMSLGFSILSVNYYTGQSPIDVYNNLFNNVSVYYEYQNHFKEMQIQVFSLSKIPFILMLFITKLILIYSYMIFFLLKKKTTSNYDKFYLLIVTFSYLYIGIGRGTSFEYFELIILILFIVFSKFKISKKTIFNPIPLILVFSIGAVGVYLFFSGINARGVEFNFTNIRPDVNYDSSEWLSRIFPGISYVLFGMYGYFGFGFFYISTYMSELWFASVQNFVSGFLPFGYELYTGRSLHEEMSKLIDIGVRWHPDFSGIVNKFGYFGLLLVCYLLGVLAKKSSSEFRENPMYEMIKYIILLQMISFPVGNFLFTSSSNQLLVLLLLVYWVWITLIKKKVVLFSK